MGNPTVRQAIRQWWEGELDGADRTQLPDLATKGALVLRQDRDFCEAFLDACLRPMVYSVGANMLSQWRGQTQRAMHKKGDASLPPSTKRVSAAQIAAAIEAEPVDWSRWLEYDPTTGSHVAILSMTKEQALAAAHERESRADPDLRRAGLLRLAAGRLQPGQRIEDAWTPDALAGIEAALEITRPQYSLGKGTIFELMREAS